MLTEMFHLSCLVSFAACIFSWCSPMTVRYLLGVSMCLERKCILIFMVLK